MVLDDIRKTFEAVLGQLTPARAQQLAKRYLEPNAAKEQVSKTAGELVQLSQRLREAVRKEVTAQMRSMGVATQDELDALRKRVRDLERAVGKSGTGGAVRKTTRAKTTARTRSPRGSATRKPPAAS
ncbi:MAG TPA: phasin family protein [Actinomycetota bacterium]|nr:phasin family protein [Actinomycetota bacterium]